MASGTTVPIDDRLKSLMVEMSIAVDDKDVSSTVKLCVLILNWHKQKRIETRPSFMEKIGSYFYGESSKQGQQKQTVRNTWTCLLCTCDNELVMKNCSACGQIRGTIQNEEQRKIMLDIEENSQPQDENFEDKALDNDWVCGTCAEANRYDALECLTCGQQKSDGYVLDTTLPNSGEVDRCICEKCDYHRRLEADGIKADASEADTSEADTSDFGKTMREQSESARFENYNTHDFEEEPYQFNNQEHLNPQMGYRSRLPFDSIQQRDEQHGDHKKPSAKNTNWICQMCNYSNNDSQTKCSCCGCVQDW